MAFLGHEWADEIVRLARHDQFRGRPPKTNPPCAGQWRLIEFACRLKHEMPWFHLCHPGECTQRLVQRLTAAPLVEPVLDTHELRARLDENSLVIEQQRIVCKCDAHDGEIRREGEIERG